MVNISAKYLTAAGSTLTNIWRNIPIGAIFHSFQRQKKEATPITKAVNYHKDPLAKKGAIGAYNKANHPIQGLIEAELSDIYEPANGGRFQLISADSIAGVMVYDDKFVYSNHASDPAYAQLLNAYDLIRVHRFGHLDEKEGNAAMLEFASQNTQVKAILREERREDTLAAFTEDDNWENMLSTEKLGKVKNTLSNLLLIMEKDPSV